MHGVGRAKAVPSVCVCVFYFPHFSSLLIIQAPIFVVVEDSFKHNYVPRWSAPLIFGSGSAGQGSKGRNLPFTNFKKRICLDEPELEDGSETVKEEHVSSMKHRKWAAEEVSKEEKGNQ